jgi:hypothetical protein
LLVEDILKTTIPLQVVSTEQVRAKVCEGKMEISKIDKMKSFLFILLV